MRNILIIGCFITLLAGCGGGSSSTNNNGSSSTSTSPKAGDTYVYQDTTSGLLGAANTPATTNISRKLIQGNLTTGLTVNDYYGNYNNYSFDLADVSTNTIANTGCTFSTAYTFLPMPWSVGETSNLTTTETCPLVTSNINISTQALGYETITVAAGTFNTLKVQITKNVSGGVTITSYPAYIENETCWYDVISGFAVKCTGNYDYTKSVGSTVTGLILFTNLGVSGKFDFTTELVSINPSISLNLSANTTDIGKTNTSLNLAAGQTGNLISASGNYKLQVAQPVYWSNSASSLDTDAQFTVSSDGMSYVSSPVVGQKGATPASYVVTATLKSDPSKIITVNISQN